MPIWTDLTGRVERLNEVIVAWSRLNILVVTDTIVSFGPEHDPRNLNETFFGMSHLIGVLEGVATLTKAHRSSDPLTAPNVISDFMFDKHDLGGYDQIWLLGWDPGDLASSRPLSPAEQVAIITFMNGGGGVFATGDHASLGAGLAGLLPRVRSMRRWAPPGAPPPLGPERVDTTMPDGNDVVVFENQSDDIPQKLQLKWYQWSASRWFRETYPHPLMCSSDGPITEFPDHMHEGEVVFPDTLDAVMTVGGMTFDEYPKDTNGQRVAPEIVAWGWTTGRADPEVMHGIHTGDTNQSRPRWNGVVGAYDGHRAAVGRVVVDSTWHHFFDINLIGDNAANRPGFSDPRAPVWRQGFNASSNGQRVLAHIDQYYRNIALWLAGGVTAADRFNAIVALLGMSHPIREVLEASQVSALNMGRYAWEYALRLYPPCTILELFSIVLPEVVVIPVRPWDGPTRGRDAASILPWSLPARVLSQVALGGALLAFVAIESLEELEGERGGERLRAGALKAIRELIDEEARMTKATLEQLERAGVALRRAQ